MIGAVVSAALITAVPLITKFEGTRYRAYPDIGQVLTICSGHTGPDVVVNKVYSPKECQALTVRDATIAAQGVLKYSPQLAGHKYILAAAISFSYNVGVGTYERSSVRRDFDRGDFVAGCNDLLKYDIAGGKHSKGLHSRRVEERQLCLTGIGVPNAK
jgi:lysozyme